ncbi:hypothetical protein Prum_048620 [Phytohabitans rumicis]|uniref:Uncharacterized protein n=1 Tax=Phytohabitans rumicis TaxID=1076125 RepID=A0A6V8L6Q0_9ACTN|nr:hypothetical protein Prum_048620 [Phytohabitans rumicis]
MQHTVEAGAARQHLCRVVDGCPDERRLRGERLRVAGAQVVQDDHLMAGVEQQAGDDAADVSGPAGDEQFHVVTFLGSARRLADSLRAPAVG